MILVYVTNILINKLYIAGFKEKMEYIADGQWLLLLTGMKISFLLMRYFGVTRYSDGLRTGSIMNFLELAEARIRTIKIVALQGNL